MVCCDRLHPLASAAEQQLELSLTHVLVAVYGRENRLKVSQDEAKYEEEQRGKRQKHEQVKALACALRDLIEVAPSC